MAATDPQGKQPVFMIATEGKSKDEIKAEARAAYQAFLDAGRKS